MSPPLESIVTETASSNLNNFNELSNTQNKDLKRYGVSTGATPKYGTSMARNTKNEAKYDKLRKQSLTNAQDTYASYDATVVAANSNMRKNTILATEGDAIEPPINIHTYSDE